MMILRYLSRRLITLTLCAFLSVSLSQAQEIAVIVGANSTIKHLSLKQVQRIFLRKERLTKQGKQWIPVNLNNHHLQRKIFTKQLLKKSTFELERYWNEQYFNGISPPYVLASEEAVLRFVSETPNALGYILDCRMDQRVKHVYTLRIKAVPELCP